MFKNLNNEEFQLGMQAPDAVIIDVRTNGEVSEGIIPGAKHIDIMGGNFISELQTLDPSKSYYVYCRSGNRSSAACAALVQAGFNRVFNLARGIMGWTGAIVQTN
jgi:rhodanese-related sulfurtransferase